MPDKQRQQFWYPGNIIDNTENARLIEKFLGFLPVAPVVDQLKERGVRRLYFDDLRGRWPSNGGGLLTPKKEGGFWIEFDLVDSFDIEYVAETIGHELCHTFSYDIFAKPPEKRWAPSYEAEEALCEEFAKRWLGIHSNRRETISLISNVVRCGELWIG